jgi:hypothetical protein
MNAFTTATQIEQLTLAILGPKPCAKERYVLTNSLNFLVWSAKSEYRMDMNRSIQKATAMVAVRDARRGAKEAIRKASANQEQTELDLRVAL